MNLLRSSAGWMAVALCVALFACKSDSGTESENEDQGGSITFSGQCVHPAVPHSFTMAAPGKVSAKFVGTPPSGGTLCMTAEDNSTFACGVPSDPSREVTGTFPAGKHTLSVGFTNTVPSCSYTVQVDFPK